MRFWSGRFGKKSDDGIGMPMPVPPGDDPFTALARIADRLEALRGARDAPAAGLAEIELAARGSYRSATRRYLSGLHTQSPDTLTAWGEVVETCLMRLAHAHQSLAIPWNRPRRRTRLRPEDVPTLLSGGIRTCAALLKWSAVRRAPEPVGVWGDVCRLYAMAEGRGCARTTVAAQPELGLRSSPEREFLKACMLSVVRPASLEPGQVDIAERVAEFCSAEFVLSGAADPAVAHLVDIEGGEAPYPRTPDTALRTTLRGVGPGGAEHLLAALTRLVDTDRLPPRAFGAEVEKAMVMATLRRLEASWATGPCAAGAPARPAEPRGDPAEALVA